MYIITCKICGVEFEAPNKAIEYCTDCKTAHSLGFNKPKPRKSNPNQKLMDDVKAATAANMSYGTYKGRKI